MEKRDFQYNGIAYNIIEVCVIDQKCERCDFYNKPCFYLKDANKIPHCTYEHNKFIFVKKEER